MIDTIDQTRKLLEQLLETHDIKDKEVLEVSQKLDNIILQYYKLGYDDLELVLNDGAMVSIKKVI